jgi:hypothetical protein
MFHTATTTYRDRRTTYSFDGPVIEEKDVYDGEDIWNERIKVSCSHNKDKKRYEAYVSWCKASSRGNFSIEQHAIFTDPNVQLATAPTGRFSENKFEAFCTEVQRVCIDIAGDEYNISTAAELLRKAQGYAAVTN